MSTPARDIVLIPSRLPDAMPWWRFSLREFLLAATAAAALVALAVKSFPSTPSSFVRQFDARVEFEQMCAAQGIKPQIWTSSGGRSMGPSNASKRWQLAGQQTSLPLGELKEKYAQHVRTSLKEHGCHVYGNGGSSDHFSLSYGSGSRQGEFVADFVELPSGYFKLHAFCVEFTRR